MLSFRLLLAIMLILPINFCYAGTTYYVYDELNRIHQVWYGASSYIQYDYDQLGNLISKTVIGGVNDPTSPVSVATPAGGTFGTCQAVQLSCSDVGTHCRNIHYTTDGTTPTPSSPVYVGPIVVNRDTTIKFFAVDYAGNSEPINSQSYTIARTGTPHVLLTSSGIIYTSLQDAFEDAVDGDTLKVLGDQLYTDNLFANRLLTVTIDGGYAAGFGSRSGISYISGTIHAFTGQLYLKNFNIGR